MAKCFFCSPVVMSVEGGDHTGKDFFLCCLECGTRTEAHVEGHTATPEIKKMLRDEWRAGRIAAGLRSLAVGEG